MYYQCMAHDCAHSFEAKEQNGKIILFTNCPKCGCVCEFRDGVFTAMDFIKQKEKELADNVYSISFTKLSNCPFAYDCYLYDQYTSDCETRKQIDHKCLIRFDEMLYAIDQKLDKILSHLHKS